MRSQVLLIGGRSGVGKTAASLALHELLSSRGVRHAVLEGDYLDLAHPAPHLAHPEAGLAERNLRAVWSNYRGLGYRRLIYTNTASVLFADALAVAMGDDPWMIPVLLRAGESAVSARLTERGHGHASPEDLQHSATTAARLDYTVPATIHRIDTDELTPQDVATRLAELTGWMAAPTAG